VHLWLVLILAVAGGLAGHYVAGLRPGSGSLRLVAYGAGIGAVVGVLLPVVLGLVGFLFQLVFALGIVLVLVLAVVVLWRLVRR
jgi:hypothetical protein